MTEGGLTSSEGARDYGRGLLLGRTVRLRPLTEDDLPHLDRWWRETEWQPLQQPTVRPRPAGTAADLFRAWSANTDPGAVGLSVETLEDTRLVGHVTLHGAALPQRTGTLGIILGPEHTGHGYGSDAVRVLLRYAFQEMNLHRVELSVWGFNTDARRAYERCGFVVEGRRREAVFHAGRYHDDVVMGVLASEWNATGPS